MIMDASKSVAPGAIVNVKSEQTGLSRMVQASEEGSYVIPFLPPGRYVMEVVAPGFQTFRQTGIAIDASQTARIDFTLQPGAHEQSVTISADSTLVRTDQSGVGTVINQLVDDATIAITEHRETDLDSKRCSLSPGATL